MFVVHTSNCHGQNCTRRAIYRLGIDTLIANILVVLCSRKIFNVNIFEIAKECIKKFGVSDVAEAVATRNDKRYASNSRNKSAKYVLFIVEFSFYFIFIYHMLPILMNKDVFWK